MHQVPFETLQPIWKSLDECVSKGWKSRLCMLDLRQALLLVDDGGIEPLLCLEVHPQQSELASKLLWYKRRR